MFRRLFIPAMFSSFGWALSDMADSVVLGQKLGTIGLATISLILPVYMVNNIFLHGIGLGGSVRYARLMGEGENEKAKDNFAQMFLLTLIFSITTAVLGIIFINPLLHVLGTKPEDGELFTATRAYLQIQLAATPLYYLSNVFNYYLRNDGSERRAGVGSVVGNISDIVLNFVLVLAVGMGTSGAALSTAIGQLVTIVIYLPGFFSKKHNLRFALPKKGWLKSSFKMLWAGLATSVQYLYQTVFFLICNNVLIRIGGETGIAVFDIIQSVSYLVIYMYEGTARAMQPILSTYHGERNEPGRKTLLRIGFIAGMIAGNAIMIFIAIFPGVACEILGVAGTEAETIAHIALRVYSIGAFFMGISILLCNYFQSYEREKLSFLIETLRGAAILLPVTFLCSRFGLTGFWWLFPITEGVSFIIAMIVIAIINKHGKPADTITEDRIFRRTILSTSNDIGSASADLEEFCEKWEANMRQQYTVMMTVEELGLTILQHGFEGRDDGYIQITVIALENGDFELHLRDDARSFDPFSLETARVQSDDDAAGIDSIGVLMIKKRSKEFHYRQYQGFNTLIVKI